MSNPNPFFVATYNGFLVVEPVKGGRTRVYTDSDIRMATPFASFEQADKAAKWGVHQLFPSDLAYFALLQAPAGPPSPFPGDPHD